MAETKQVPAPAAQKSTTAATAKPEKLQSEVGAHEKSNFPPFDPTYFASQLVWLAIAFGIFYVLMSRLAIPRVAGILDARKDKIARDLAEAQRLKADTDAAVAAYEKTLAEARRNAGAIASETRAKLNAEVDAKRHAAEETLNQKLAAAEAQIGEIKSKALAEVGGIARETAEAVVASLSQAYVSPAEVAAAVDKALL